MKFNPLFVFIHLLLLLTSASCTPCFAATIDEILCSKLLSRHGFLEEVHGKEALNWVDENNQKTLSHLTSHPKYNELLETALANWNSKDRIAGVKIRGGYAYNFWKDADHPRGYLRRASVESYIAGAPDWETVFNLDEIASDEGENWVFKGTNIHEDSARALVYLSRGGKDAVEIREFNLNTKEFLEDGFFLPEAKSQISWIDENTLAVGTNTGEHSLTDSGYPRTVRIWQRSTPLAQSTLLFEGQKTDLGVGAQMMAINDEKIPLVGVNVNFWESKAYWVDKKGKAKELKLPSKSRIMGNLGERLIVHVLEDWQVAKNQTIKRGSIVSVDFYDLAKGEARESIETLFSPGQGISIEQIEVTKSAIFVSAFNNVNGQLFEITPQEESWSVKEIPTPLEHSSIEIYAEDSENNRILFTTEGFLNPTKAYSYQLGQTSPELIYEEPAKFDASEYVVRQHWAGSKDGTNVPYFIMHHKDVKYDGNNPTLLYGYGGFEISMTPKYSPTREANWLREGGVFVLANIRGGGEFGPDWHEAGMKEKKQNVFDDFIAVAENLIGLRVTSPKKLGVQGGSNGGLLTGAMLTQRPDLFNAVIIEVPLLDMLRYHHLLAGASWMGEYGNPDAPEERAYIRRYSPYHNLSYGRDYPTPFFVTSTKDDRVHPAHARKMAKLMEERGLPFYYFENHEGGHGAGANNEQHARRHALEYAYLWERLGH